MVINMTRHYTRNNGIGTGGVILIILVLFGGFYAMTSGFKNLSFNSPTSPSGSTTVSPQNLGVCPSFQPTLGIIAKYPDFSKTPTVPTQVATAANVYLKGSTTSLAAISTTAGGPATTTNGIQCGSSYLVTAGDGLTSYYLNYTYINIGTNSTPTVVIQTPKYSAPTLQVANSVAATFTSNGAFIRSVAAGQTVTSAYITLQAGQYNFGQQNIAVQFIYNSPAISGISISGAPQVSSALLPPANFLSSNTGIGGANGAGLLQMGVQSSTAAYLLPPIAQYQYAGLTPSAGIQYINPIITVGSSYGANEPIGVVACGAQNWWNTTSGRVDTGVFINSVTKAGLTACAYTNNAFVLDNH